MKIQVVSAFAITVSLSFFSCSQNLATSTHTSDSTSVVTLTQEKAKVIFELPIHCLEVEYPNILVQVLGADENLKSPKQLRPIFYGCFDWHSSVHGYWSIVELMQKYSALDADAKVRKVLNAHI